MPAILGLKNKKLVRFYHPMHLGDCVHFLHFLRKFTKVNPGVEVEFYFNEKYEKELTEQNDDPHIRLIGKYIWTERGDASKAHYTHNLYDFWQRYRDLGCPNVPRTDPVIFTVYNEMYVYFFQFMCKKLGYVCPIQKPEDMLFDNPGILKPTPMSREWDYLLINSFPLSNQVNGTEAEMDAIFDRKIEELRGKTIVTTKKVRDLPCTRDHNLSLLGIANLSTMAKNIVGINTGPYCMCFNVFNIDKVHRWVHLNDRHIYRYNNRITCVHTKEEFAALNIA